MNFSFIKPKKKEEVISEEDKKIEFAGKSGEDLDKKDPVSHPAANKDSAGGFLPEENSAAAPLAGKKSFSLTDFFKKLNSGFYFRKKEDDEVLEVNLVKEEIVKFFDWQKGLLTLFLAVFVSLAILSSCYWLIFWWAERKQVADSNTYARDYFKITKEIRDLDSRVEEAMVFKQRFDLAVSLLDKHIYWSNFFNFLEDNTLSNVYFSSFSGDISGNYQFGATSDNIDTINAQIKKLLNNPYVRKAQVDSTSIGEGANGAANISFQLVFSVDPEIFLKKNETAQ